MLKIEYSGQFKRDLKKLKKRCKDMEKIKLPMNLLIQEKTNEGQAHRPAPTSETLPCL